jgi:NIPSNAP protein
VRAATPVIELRNYLLADGARGDFIRYFEEHFLVSQRDVGMQPLGQFAVVDAPNRFAWIRGFDDMPARRRGLESFYGGAFWQARRAEANAMMREHHDVHLLRPLGPIDALTGGLSLEDRASEPPGVVPQHTGLAVVDFYRTEPVALPRLVEAFEQRWRGTLAARGHPILGHFVAELTPNDYPRLPVVQDPGLLAVLSVYRDREHRAGLGEAAAGLPGDVRTLLTAEVTSLFLRPTARSLIRYPGPAARVPVSSEASR